MFGILIKRAKEVSGMSEQLDPKTKRKMETLHRWERALDEADWQRTKPDVWNQHKLGRNLTAKHRSILRRRKKRQEKCRRRVEQCTKRWLAK